MSKKIEEVFDLPPMQNEVNASFPSDQEEQTTGLDLEKMQQQLEVADKIDAALPQVEAPRQAEEGRPTAPPLSWNQPCESRAATGICRDVGSCTHAGRPRLPHQRVPGVRRRHLAQQLAELSFPIHVD